MHHVECRRRDLGQRHLDAGIARFDNPPLRWPEPIQRRVDFVDHGIARGIDTTEVIGPDSEYPACRQHPPRFPEEAIDVEPVQRLRHR
jgi:hypothetical protein